MKLYDAPLVAERALEVFGGLEKARMGIRARQVVADAVAARREQVVADMALRSAEAARRTMPRTAPERLCVSLDIAPQTSITQTKAMETFNLEKHHLYGVAHQTKPNPRNPRWSPMKLYKAADVAEQAIRFRTVSES